MKKKLSVILLLAVCACASHTGVVPLGKDTYMIAKQEATGFPGLGNIKAEIIAEGTQYCAGLGKKFQIVSMQFMCLAADDPEFQRPKLQKEPDTVIEMRKH